MKPQRFRIIVLILVGVLIAVQGLLSDVLANQLQDRLGPWASYVLPIFLLITAGLIGFTVRDQLTKVATESHGASIDRR